MRILNFTILRLARATCAVSAVVLMAGCGAGIGQLGSGGQTVVIGRVTNATGHVVPGATVSIAGTNEQTASLQQGGYSLTNTPSGVLTVLATTSAGGVAYSGSTQTFALSNLVTSNANIVITPQNQQCTITGTVTNTSGQALNNVVVVIQPTGETAYTNGSGRFTLTNVSTANSSYTLVASEIGYTNGTLTVNTPAAGATASTANLQLAVSSNQPANAPTGLGGMSITEPSIVLQPNAQSITGSPTSNGIYETIRRQLSPRYASLAVCRQAGQRTKTAAPHDVAGGYIVGVNLFWNEIATPSLAGFQIFAAANSNPLTLYDQLPNPTATEYEDINPAYNAGTQYSFAVQAVSNNDVATSFSNTTSLTPLDAFTLLYPSQGATIPAQSTLSWEPVARATSYAAFIYNGYPTIGAQTVVAALNLGTSYTLPATLPAGTYYLVAAAVDSNGDVSLSDITPFTLQ